MHPRSEPTDQEILILWRHGKNTNDISRQLWWPENLIAHRLPRILQRERQDQEWVGVRRELRHA